MNQLIDKKKLYELRLEKIRNRIVQTGWPLVNRTIFESDEDELRSYYTHYDGGYSK